ncbi:MAG: TIGR01777 family oxidoreductase [Flavobacteriaceae bacterium]|nr:TIGR01777 family oxidoreductase [Flavobacteriaceae bacterium]
MLHKEIVLITGASGMIAKKLATLLQQSNYEVRFLSRTKKNANQFIWNIAAGFIDPNALKDVEHIIHLAGANISDERWSNNRKKAILESRVQSTQLLYEKIKEENISLKTFITASAVGYYGTPKENVLFTEESSNGNDFLAEVCLLWEMEAEHFAALENVRVVKLRFGVVLDSSSGALAKMIKPIKMGFGAVLGNGQQYIPWIHLEDLCQLLLFSLKNTAMNGVYNAVAPQYLTNKELTYLLAKKLNRKICLPKIPKFVLRLILGEMASIVLKGNRISSKKLLSTGFTFNYPEIEKALDDLFK